MTDNAAPAGPAQAAAASSDVTADMTAVTYCDSATIRSCSSPQGRPTIRVGTEGAVTGTLLEVSGLDQVATVVTRD